MGLDMLLKYHNYRKDAMSSNIIGYNKKKNIHSRLTVNQEIVQWFQNMETHWAQFNKLMVVVKKEMTRYVYMFKMIIKFLELIVCNRL